MIIVEGPDGAGKTTLVHALRDHLSLDQRGYSIDSRKGPGPERFEWFEQELDRPAWAQVPSIYDRCPLISEPIYMPIMSRGPLVDERFFEGLMEDFLTTAKIIIFCRPPLEVVIENVMSTQSEQLEGMTPDWVKKIYWLYDYTRDMYWHLSEKQQSPPTRIYHYNYTGPAYDFIAARVENYLTRRSAGTW